MDVRFVAWAGYQLKVCGDTINVIRSVPVCNPVLDGNEIGTRHVSGRGTKISITGEGLKPIIRAEELDN